MLEIRNAVKTFAKGTPHAHRALNGINLHVNQGEFITIIGSNGAGKSTLFNAIAGNFFLDQGNVIVAGKDISFMPEHRRAAFIGRIFQDPLRGSAPQLTLEENLAISYTNSRLKPLAFALNKKNRDVFREKLAVFGMGLENRLNTKVGLLSGGQRQAVTLLMSTILVPDVLLLDEHTAALDPNSAETVMAMTEKIVEEKNLTTLMITHNLESALKTGTRTVMMDKGCIILDVAGEERAQMKLDDVMNFYKDADRAGLSDRMLLTR